MTFWHLVRRPPGARTLRAATTITATAAGKRLVNEVVHAELPVVERLEQHRQVHAGDELDASALQQPAGGLVWVAP